MNAVKHKTNSAQLRGLVIPEKWDTNGAVTGVSIQTYDEKVFLVEHTQMGNRLLAFIHKQVEVCGKIKERPDENALIDVFGFDIIEKETLNPSFCI